MKNYLKKMTKFKISTYLCDNLCVIANEEITNTPCYIHINNTKSFEIPLILAVASSSKISQQLLSDISKRDFHFDIPELGDITNEFLAKIQKALNCQEILLENDKEIIDFSYIGKAIGNNELISPFHTKCEELEKNINKENCINLLTQKFSLGFERKLYLNEISFIAQNFTSMKEDLLSLCENPIYQPLLEEILNNEHLKLNNEDELLEFVLSLCSKNSIYEIDFQYIWLEYCSVDYIKLLLDYVKERFIKSQNEHSLFSCISRRLIQTKIPILNDQFPNRYLNDQTKIDEKYKNWIKVDYNSNNLEGIFYQENKKGNIKVNNNDLYPSNAFDLFKADDDAYYESKDEPNACIEVSFKNNKSFIINKYLIRGHKYTGTTNHRMRDWKLEGKQVKNGNWIELDKHFNEPIQQLQTKVFDISCQTPLNSVRLTHIGRASDNSYYMILNAFDIFGMIEP